MGGKPCCGRFMASRSLEIANDGGRQADEMPAVLSRHYRRMAWRIVNDARRLCREASRRSVLTRLDQPGRRDEDQQVGDDYGAGQKIECGHDAIAVDRKSTR